MAAPHLDRFVASLLAMTAVWDKGKETNGKQRQASLGRGQDRGQPWLRSLGFSTEVIAQFGFDRVTVDMQHGIQDYMSMVQCFQAMNGHPVTPMVVCPE